MPKLEGTQFLLTLLRSHYGEDEQHLLRRAVLEATYFIDPGVVAQTELLPVVRARRLNSGERKNTIVGREFVSDNFPPDYVFRAATNDLRDQSSTQLCHIYGGNGEARDTYFYTNLANLCLMPAFLAKLADTDRMLVELLKECAFILFNFDATGLLARAPRVAGLRDRIKTAAPARFSLFESLKQKSDARFQTAKAAGFIFAEDGSIRGNDAWVAEMISRRDLQPPAYTPGTGNDGRQQSRARPRGLLARR